MSEKPPSAVIRRRRLIAACAAVCALLLVAAGVLWAAVARGAGPGDAEAEPEQLAAPSASAPTGLSTHAADGVPEKGSGRWAALGETKRANAQGRAFPVFIRVEDGLPIDAQEAASFIMTTLQDRRGWQRLDHVAFAQVSSQSKAKVTINIAAPSTVDRLCAPATTDGELSCRNGDNVVFNARRWLAATPEFDSLAQYRTYLVSHEVGHALGHGHEKCPGRGRLAPVMQQQSISLQGCRANGWPAQR
ncbi:DUF3152 domain-containing protein [Brevibacterium sp. 5221]|uniref:DUF3152 domain-containing protein n=1 Tax=Brevibacterium rongguiense TaxID=2695267 RepID=A0A6N9H768_9MICO|nr:MULTISPECIES: DUF3152 domain-containing protein [Brevibacterium]MYM19803.1 DUF3152 domain-containing protein [Brevibacterium rongguiense]WAL40417.1 DUF3152 domain-containing protein [Brevibacterium sp. BRM-1]